MKVLVTGGAGFIGSHIVDLCITLGHQVVVVDNLSTGSKSNLNQSATFYQTDITNPNLEEIFLTENPQIVFHQAAQTQVQTSVKKPIFDATSNIIGTINLLESSRKSAVRKVIFASTAAVYGNPKYLPINEQHHIQPLSGYGAGKHTSEQYLEIYKNLYGIEYTVLRYANVYGIRQDPRGEGGVVSIFVDRVLKNLPLTIFGDGEQTRDYINVIDVARANIAAIGQGDGEIFNIGTGIDTSISELIHLFESIKGKSVPKERCPERVGDIKHSYFDSSKADNLLDWKAEISLVEGLAETFAYYRSQYEPKSVTPRS